jgi:uncharacterized membrane protein YfcA
MPSIRDAILVLFALAGIAYAVLWVRFAAADKAAGRGDFRPPTLLHVAIGFVTNFFDTLGIGSFATTTTIFTWLKLVPPERTPSTMLAGHTLPVVAQALLFLSIVDVDPVVLVGLNVALLIGGFFGARVVTRLPRRPIQIAMAVALIAAGTFMALGQLKILGELKGTALTLSGTQLAIGAAVNALLGALIMIGVGNYGPSLVLFSLLGMDPRAAFPIMMSAGAFVGPVGSVQFMRARRVEHRIALGLMIGGIPGVLVAALLVKSMPLDLLRWVIVGVVVYTAVTLLRTRPAPGANAPVPA